MSKFYLRNRVFALALEIVYQDSLKQYCILETNKIYKWFQITYSSMKNVKIFFRIDKKIHTQKILQ